MRNKYTSECKFCGLTAMAGNGYYENGYVFCTEPITYGLDKSFPYGMTCLIQYNRVANTEHESAAAVYAEMEVAREARQREYETAYLAEMVNGKLQQWADEANVRSLDDLITKILGESVAVIDLNWRQAIKISNELIKRADRRAAREHNKQLKAQNICKRCGGAGGSDKWIMTGWVCHECHGSGKYANIKEKAQ